MNPISMSFPTCQPKAKLSITHVIGQQFLETKPAQPQLNKEKYESVLTQLK